MRLATAAASCAGVKLARVFEHDRAGVVVGTIEDERERLASGQEPSHLGLARLDRLVAEIAAVELQEIESAIDRRIVALAPAKQLEVREPVLVAGDQLAVDDAGRRGGMAARCQRAARRAGPTLIA